MKNRILIVDDEEGIRFGVRAFLEGVGYEVEEAASASEALERARQGLTDLALLDYKLPDGTALDLLPQLRSVVGDVPVVILTGHGSIDLAVRAIKEGADQFVTKPVELPALEVILKRLLDQRRDRKRSQAGRSRRERDVVDPFIGDSPLIRTLSDHAHRVVTSPGPILIQGETGTGKGVLAAWLHQNGPRADEAFVDLNCAGLSRELLETDLFGHEKGSFTGAVASKAGLLEVAHRGTLFLDELGDTDVQVQPKLLKVVEEKRYRRVGDVRDRQVDVLLIAATHRDLGERAREGRFREDLYYRLNTIPLRVPALRERPGDVPLLARYLLERIAREFGRPHLSLAPEAERCLQEYSWPGNLRELRNVLERAALLSESALLGVGDLHFSEPLRLREVTQGFDPHLPLAEVEKRHIQMALEAHEGRVSEAAKSLGIPRSSLYQRLQKLGLERKRRPS